MITSLRSRILLITTSTVFVALLTTGGVTYAIVRANMLRAIEHDLKAIADGNTRAVDAWVDAKARIVTAAADAVAVGDPKGIVGQMSKSGGFPVALAGWTDKSFVSTSGHTPAGYDPTSRPWYKAAIGAGHLVVTKPYGDVSTGVPYVAFSAPMNRNGVAAGVVSGAIALDEVRNIVKSVHPTPASLAFVVSRDGEVIAHPDIASMLKPTTSLSPTLTPAALATLVQASEPLEAMVSGTPKLLQAQAVQGTDWLLVVALDKGEAMAGLASMLDTSGISLLVLTAAAVGIATALTARSFRRLAQVRDAMDLIASGGGDLTHRLPATGRDEVAQIASSFNAFVGAISAVLHEIRDSVESMKVATREIEAGNRDMSQRTEVSASNLQQTSASLTDLAGSIRRSADALVVANQLAASSSHAASVGVEVVTSAVSTMDDIARSSMRISEIIGVIDGIAFQTNILALNASVEAARAGENGRGFAVVAGEVRMLAQRSAVAAREIKALIEVAESGVKAGTQRVREAGANMSGIMEGIARLSAIISDINAALTTQSDGMTKIDRSLTELDQATQQNSALVEETTAASSVLNEQALNLSRTVGRFKLAERPASGLQDGTAPGLASETSPQTGPWIMPS